jgi:two-component system, LytTR family, response regulator
VKGVGVLYKVGMALKALVVDDEPIARQVLCEELALMPGVEVVGEASGGRLALEMMRALRPDLVFLDLEMPDLRGFEVIRAMDGAAPLPTVVVVTAYDQHAIEAFEAGAVDYLLKPVAAERLARAVERVRQQRRTMGPAAEQAARLSEIAVAQAAPGQRRSRKVVGKLGDEFHLIEVSDVLAFQAERELVWMITRKTRYLATHPLRDIQTSLAGMNFGRIHRGALVNLDHVAKMAPLSSQRWLLTLTSGLEFIVSKRNAKAIEQVLSLP